MDEDMPVVADPEQASVWAPEPQPGDRCLELVFCLDCTGSMGSYIASATQNIELICDEIIKSEKLASPACLRLALVAYRDEFISITCRPCDSYLPYFSCPHHPPQDNTYVTRVTQFTSDVTIIKSALKSLYASGGGDGPEAVTAALYEASVLPWREYATKMVVLIADAPPHGIGEYGDGFATGSPDGHDPIQLVRQMKARGITFFMVACEPALSGYAYSTDFFRGLCQISSGAMVPLTNAAYLAHVIVGSALEQMNLERLIAEVGSAVVERLSTGAHSVDDVARDLHASLSLRNESTKHLIVEQIYRDTPDTEHNINCWVEAQTIDQARPHLKRILTSRFTDAYNAKRSAGYSGYRSSYRPPVPARPTESELATATPASSPVISSSPVPSSPPRKVVSSFKPFSAASSSTISGTELGGMSGFKSSTSSGGFGASSSAFGLKGPSSPPKATSSPPPAQSDADIEDALSGVELRMAGISFEQAKKIVDHSIWRARA